MSLFGSFFKKSTDAKENKNESNVNWIPLTSTAQLKEIDTVSKQKPVIVFKHSTRCAISKNVIKNFDRSFPTQLKDKINVYYLDLLNHRDTSNEIGYKYQVLHQSPQLLLIHKGKAVLHASHYDIAQIDLEKIVK